MVSAMVLWSSRCARYEAMLAAAQAAEDESREHAEPASRALRHG